ncbi:hypothetical protein H4Q26_010499 [Puccinia striiformis f. sp. tritici PST-130]|nr:hypothetical protein H4Q26_010499 [Puccinia striiformis f. sp. tritici PST-130]
MSESLIGKVTIANQHLGTPGSKYDSSKGFNVNFQRPQLTLRQNNSFYPLRPGHVWPRNACQKLNNCSIWRHDRVAVEKLPMADSIDRASYREQTLDRLQPGLTLLKGHFTTLARSLDPINCTKEQSQRSSALYKTSKNSMGP